MRCYVCDFDEVDSSLSVARNGLPSRNTVKNTVFLDKKTGRYICSDCATVVNITVYQMENRKTKDDVE
jgi:hypothetical protein